MRERERERLWNPALPFFLSFLPIPCLVCLSGDFSDVAFIQFVCVCCDHRLFTHARTPKGVDFCVYGRLYSRLKGQSCSDFGEVHAGYVSVAGTEFIAWTSESGSFKSEYDFVHVHSD